MIAHRFVLTYASDHAHYVHFYSFPPEALSYHGYEASTSHDLHRSGDSVYDIG